MSIFEIERVTLKKFSYTTLKNQHYIRCRVSNSIELKIIAFWEEVVCVEPGDISSQVKYGSLLSIEKKEFLLKFRRDSECWLFEAKK